MSKRFRMNLTTGDLSTASGTDPLPHPGNFPVGSVESRAAARAMIRPDRPRAGDEGTFKCGCFFFMINKAEGDQTGGLVQIIMPGDGRWDDKHICDYEIVSNKILRDE
jgi:hypothetical protein